MKIGQTEPAGTPGRRDAFHVPAALVQSDGTLRPGDSVRFTDGTHTAVTLSGVFERHGIVDPFVSKVGKDERAWVLLMPGLVADLTHTFEVCTDLAAPEDDDDELDFDDEDRADRIRCAREGC